MSGKLELGYWKYRGLGHPIRFLLQYLEVPYVERRFELPSGQVTSANWIPIRDKIRQSYPPNLAFPNLPYILDGDKAVSECRAILKYIVRKYGPELMGEDETKVDMMESFLYDFWYNDFASGVVYKHTQEALDNFAAQHPIKLPLISKFVGDSKWATGDKITYVDFLLCEFLHHLTEYDNGILEPYPNLRRLRDGFKQIPAIKNYMASPDYFATPCYSTRANYKM